MSITKLPDDQRLAVDAKPADAPTDAQRLAGALRHLADFIDANPDLPGTRHAFHGVHVFPRDKAGVAAWARAAARFTGSKVQKHQADEWAGVNIDFGEARSGEAPVCVYVRIERDEICERVVVGTREVTEMVPDPQHVAAAPLVEVVKTVEDVEWRCHPILGEAIDDEPLVPVAGQDLADTGIPDPDFEQVLDHAQGVTGTTVGGCERGRA